jgi:gliding-associated putative ABC transporter substrate-binding component GldG
MKQLIQSKYSWALLLLALVLINAAVQNVTMRADLTAEQRYSLSAATRSLLKNIQEPVTIEVFLKGDFPAVFRKLQGSTADLLAEMKTYAGPGLQVKFVNAEELIPEEQKEQIFLYFTDSLRRAGLLGDSLPAGFKEQFKQQLVADSLKTLGIMPYTLQVQQKENEQSQRVIFPAALVRLNNRVIAVDLLSGKTEYSRDPLTGRLQLDEARSIGNAEALLEFKFANAIEKIQRTRKPVIGYVVGNGQPTGPETYDLVQTLEPDYNIQLIDLNRNPFIPREMAAVLVVKPTDPFSDTAKIKLDQYVMQGGKILWFLDLLRAEKDSLAFTARTLAYDRGLNLDDLLFRFGVRINRDLLQDQQCDLSKLVVGTAGGQPQLADVPFNYYPLLQPAAGHPITRNLEPVLGQFVNTMDTVRAAGINKHIVLTSSENAKTVSTPAIISLEELKTIENPKLYTRKNLPAAVFLEGNFNSLYANRISAALKDSFSLYYGSFKNRSVEPTSQLVVADGDIVLNSFTQREPFAMGYSRVQERSFANRAFLENTLQYMTGNGAIVALRNKEVTVRLLNTTKIEESRLLWQLINIVAPLVLLLLGALVFNRWRKAAYQTS